MGLHTWFLKSKELYLKEKDIDNKLESFENGEIHLDDIEVKHLNEESDNLFEINQTEYHDLFRTNKRNEDVIFSKGECFEWINNPDNKVSFKNTIFDTDEQEEVNKKYCMEKLEEFWGKYPNGVIYFS